MNKLIKFLPLMCSFALCGCGEKDPEPVKKPSITVKCPENNYASVTIAHEYKIEGESIQVTAYNSTYENNSFIAEFDASKNLYLVLKDNMSHPIVENTLVVKVGEATVALKEKCATMGSSYVYELNAYRSSSFTVSFACSFE